MTYVLPDYDDADLVEQPPVDDLDHERDDDEDYDYGMCCPYCDYGYDDYPYGDGDSEDGE